MATTTSTRQTQTAAGITITTTTVTTVTVPVIPIRPRAYRPVSEVSTGDVVQDREGNRFLVTWTLSSALTFVIGLLDLDYGTESKWTGTPDGLIFIER